MKKIKVLVFIMLSFLMFMVKSFSVMATSPAPAPNFSYRPVHVPESVPGSSNDVSLPVPVGNCSPALTPAERTDIEIIIESSEVQEVVIDMFEEGAEYGISQRGYAVNSQVYQVSPEATAMAVMYSGYQALYALYGDDPDYQYFIQPYKDTDSNSLFGDFLPMNTILGTFTYGEIRLDALIDEKTGEIKAAVLSYQDGFESTVEKFLSKVSNNFYLPAKPDFECDAYGLTQLSAVPAYSYRVDSACDFEIRWIDSSVLASIPPHFCCYLKRPLGDSYQRQLVLVSTEPLPSQGAFYHSGGMTYGPKSNFSNVAVNFKSEFGMFKSEFWLSGIENGYYFYVGYSLAHRMAAPAPGFSDYYYPYVSFNMSLDEFKAYYVDNAGELSVGGVLLTPVQPSSQAFPQPGNVYNPSDLQDYNNDQRKKIEECPVINPQSEPYPGSSPAPGVESKPGTLPQIIPDPATGGITVLPVVPSPNPNPLPGGDPVIDPGTGEEIDNGDLAPYMFDLSRKFPFCVPFDLVKCVKVLKQKPAAPSFEWTLRVGMIDFEYTFRIDLTDFEPAAKVCRVMFTLLFIVSLIVVTRNLIRG